MVLGRNVQSKPQTMASKYSSTRTQMLAPGPHPAGVLADHLSRVVDAFTVDMVQPREDGSCVFYVNQMGMKVVLRYSGASGVFFKMHADEVEDPMELFWLPEECTLDQALEYAKDVRARGLAEKGKNGRLAVRFVNEGDMDAFAKAQGFPVIERHGRWKVTRIPMSAGVEGVHRLLVSLKWDEILFHDERQCIFLSKNHGHDAPANYMFQQMPRSIKFKAINAAARESVAAESMGPGLGRRGCEPRQQIAGLSWPCGAREATASSGEGREAQQTVHATTSREACQ